jgi:cryptochrome
MGRRWQLDMVELQAFFSIFYRVYSPVAFGRKTGVEGAVVKYFMPELKKFNQKYIYEPWKAPIADQKRWDCMIKRRWSVQEEGGMKVYSKPMFDFYERRQILYR